MTVDVEMKHDGITCTLSKDLPTYIEQNVHKYVDMFLERNSLARDQIDFWAVHPGGKRIIEKCEVSLGLSQKDTEHSWKVLEKYGNMLSPSVLYVLKRIFKQFKKQKELSASNEGFRYGMAFSFSPGVGVEGIILKQV